ncbi:hypothetical protein [Cellulomonas sp. KRMCY2]|uniref:hypothetical protein n=1 Tax=Cellulomonas sp. KRMCY2 TaxID=1304865 RepID=UPI00045EA668|nr:hypothetical protein [Cellulomonas sp. KRMCY2]
MQEVRLTLIFANQDGLVDLLGLRPVDRARFLPATGDTQTDRAVKQHGLTDRLQQLLRTDPPAELQRLLLTSLPFGGQLVAVEQAFYFRRRSSNDFVDFHAQLNTDKQWRLEGVVDTSRFPFSSTSEHLRKRNNVLMVAIVSDVQDQTIRLRPLFIGHRSWLEETAGLWTPDERRVHVQQVDQFSEVDWAHGVSRDDATKVNNMREDVVKDALAAIIGSPFVPKDWGGERSDLSTNNLLVSGQQTSAAWLLKGRSVKGTMQIAHLGKNGDQIERLATEPVELLVVQHNDAISAPVVHMAETFAYDMRNPRRFMIMDGLATAMILRDYGHLK